MSLRRWSWVVVATLISAAVCPALPPAQAAASAAPLYAPVGPGTHFVDEDAALAGFNDADWYKANIPFLDVPDPQIQSVYYYRWRTWKEHLRYTDPQDGWISTEFLDCCGYAAPYQAIDAAAGHQITDGRWLRDQTYDEDYIRFWLTGPGASAKPATDEFNSDTTDWAHEYSFWLASAAYGQAEASGDTGPLVQLLPELERQYHGWDKQFNAKIGLYWSVPVWDAMEYSASSYASSDPYHGGAGYRPTLNSYQYGDATAISKIAALAGDKAVADEYSRRAAALKSAMQKQLWDPDRDFYYHVARDDNPGLTKLGTREEIGFIPWMFDAAEPQDASAWSQLLDPQGFAAPYGPTTAERRSPDFLRDAGNCCRWDGPSWPFATSQTLTGMANLLDDYPAQKAVNSADYAAALHTFAATQYRNGVPYVAEAHSPDQPVWSYDSYDHSEDYNHSTFTDLVISGLMGLRPSTGDQLTIKPLTPAGWDHFALENVPYHGHNITLEYDRDGSHYHVGTGLHVYVDGRVTASRQQIGALSVTVPAAIASAPSDLVNDAANPLRSGFPKPITSYTWQNDDPWNAIDGKVWFDEVPEDTRWTNYASPDAQDFYGVDFGVLTKVSDVRWYGYDDGGGVRPAAGYRLQYWTGSAWRDIPNQTRSSATPVGNGLNRITFPALNTTQVRLLFTDPPGAFVGITEFQAWNASSPALALKVGPPGPGGTVAIDGPTTVQVTATNTTDHSLTDVRLRLSLPAGWSAGPLAPVDVLPPGASRSQTVLLTPAPNATPGEIDDVQVTAEFGTPTQSSHLRAQVRIAFPPGQSEPVGTWTFDEGGGVTAHDTAGTHDLTLTAGAGWTAGHAGSALSTDGQSGYAASSTPVLDTVGTFSVAAWVRLDSTGNFATAVSQDGATTSGFFLQYSGADGRFAFSTGEGRALADAAPIAGRWYHLVGVHDANAGTYTLYVDGQAQKSVLTQANGDSSTGPFAVGRGFSGSRPSDFWPGAIDQVHAWNRALSAADVHALYRTGT